MDHYLVSFWIKDCHLRGQSVELIPLFAEHKDALIEAASDGELWKLWYTSVPSPQNIDDYIESALSNKAKAMAIIPLLYVT
ncbi:MAG: hypothetical protein Q9M92_09625 [Enterobacterales bacterium]|nr:hypothetical protein [Enterobacterales bacterium]